MRAMALVKSDTLTNPNHWLVTFEMSANFTVTQEMQLSEDELIQMAEEQENWPEGIHILSLFSEEDFGGEASLEELQPHGSEEFGFAYMSFYEKEGFDELEEDPITFFGRT